MFRKLLLLILWSPSLVWADAYAILNYSTAQYEHEYNTGMVSSIASITKLFTAYTIVRSGVDMTEKVIVQGKSAGRFPRKNMVSRQELFKAMLVSSDNLAAESLAHAHPGGIKKFLEDTAQHIDELKLFNTTIVEPTGLFAENKSTIEDISKFLFHIKDYAIIAQTASERETVSTYTRGNKTVKVSLRNTNPAMWVYDNIVLSKTGFTNAAGRCVAMLVQKNNNLFAVIVLGQKTQNQRTLIVNNLIGKL